MANCALTCTSPSSGSEGQNVTVFVAMAAFNAIDVVFSAELSLVEGVTNIVKSLVRVINVVFYVSLFVLFFCISYISLLTENNSKTSLYPEKIKGCQRQYINYDNLLIYFRNVNCYNTLNNTGEPLNYKKSYINNRMFKKSHSISNFCGFYEVSDTAYLNYCCIYVKNHS